MNYLPYIIILLLYIRTYKYQYLTDDPVPRDGYLYMLPQNKPPAWYDRQRSFLCTFTNITVFMGVCGYIHLLWGWQPALLYAVYPLNVCGVAWNTGNYYMSTVLLILSTHLFGNYAGIAIESSQWLSSGLLSIMACGMYSAALNSTTNALAYIFISPFFSNLWFILILPFITFLKGKRMKTGLKLRDEGNINKNVDPNFKWIHLIHAPKVLAYYIYLSIFPMRLGFFHSWGNQKNYGSKYCLIASGILLLLFFNLTLYIDYKMCFWWFFSIGIFTHITGTKGQYIAERYLPLANVAFCVLLSQILTSPIIFTIIATLYFCKSLSYIPVWRTDESLYKYSMVSQPEAVENYNNLANYYTKRGDVLSAVPPLQVAEILTKGDKFLIYLSLAKCYYASHHFIKCLKYLDLALKKTPKDRQQEVQTMRNDVWNKIVTLRKNEKILKKKGILG